MKTEKQKVQQILKIITPYLGMFPSNKMGGDSLILYATILANDYEPAEIAAAMMKLIKTAKFFPRIAEIVDAIDSLRDSAAVEAGKKVCPSEGEAWQEVMTNIRINYVYKPWIFSDPAVEQAVKQFGKMELVNLKLEDMNTARAQFMRIYKFCVSREKEHQQNCEALAKIGLTKGAQLESIIASFKEMPSQDKKGQVDFLITK